VGFFDSFFGLNELGNAWGSLAQALRVLFGQKNRNAKLAGNANQPGGMIQNAFACVYGRQQPFLQVDNEQYGSVGIQFHAISPAAAPDGPKLLKL
jgi:hypothetical protein